MDRTQLPHYHIRWCRIAALDWECFATRKDAETRAAALVRRDETYVIEEHGEACPRCQAAMDLKHEHGTAEEAAMSKTGPNPEFKYPWQQLVSDAFMESRSEYLPGRINAAEQAISARLLKAGPTELDERSALREALRALRALLPEKSNAGEEPGSKAAIA